jgi:hypothetical protein
MIKNYSVLYVKYTAFLSDFNETWISLTFSKNTQILNFMKIQNPSIGSRVVPCGQTDGRTDVTKSIVLFQNFAKAPKSRLLASSYLFCSPSVRRSVCRTLNSNSAVPTGRMFLQFDSVNCWNKPFVLMADNNMGRFTWMSNFHLYWR